MKIFKSWEDYTPKEFAERMLLHVKGAYILINSSIAFIILGLIFGVIL